MKNTILYRVLILLIQIPVILSIAHLINTIAPNVGILGLYLMTVMLSAGAFHVIDNAIVKFFEWNLNRKLKKYGFNSYKEAKSTIEDLDKYIISLSKLSPEDQLEISDKAVRTNELINDYESRPDFYFENMNTTKEKMITQISLDFKNWMKQRGYPTWEVPKKRS